MYRFAMFITVFALVGNTLLALYSSIQGGVGWTFFHLGLAVINVMVIKLLVWTYND